MKQINFLSVMAGVLLLALLCPACTGETPPPVTEGPEISVLAPAMPPPQGTGTAFDAGAALSLERIAEIERAGGYFPGLGLVESSLREKTGDYTGAALAAYKELAWAYGYGSVERQQMEESLQNAITLSLNLPVTNGSAADALRGCVAFAGGDWELAKKYLSGPGEEAPDSFLSWMLLVCALEGDGDAGVARQAYGAIRARYALFPEYWYRGARAFSADGNIAASYAEQCINISPQGPFAEECRRILARQLGISHAGIRTRVEIENIIIASTSVNNPAVLEELFPLMDLPENPYTLYALGALKSLAAIPEYRDFFDKGARKASGRLAERLSYIARG